MRLSRPHRALVQDTIDFARTYQIYGANELTRQLVLDAVDTPGVVLIDVLPRCSRPSDQRESDIRELIRRSGVGGRPLIEGWLGALAERLEGHAKNDARVACEALQIRWQSLPPPSETWGPTVATPRTRRSWWIGAGLGAAVVAGISWWGLREPVSRSAPCEWADSRASTNAAQIVGSGFIVDVRAINLRLRAFSVDGRRVDDTPLDMVKIVPPREGGPARVRVVSGVDRELSEVVIHAERGTVVVRWGGSERAQGDAIQLRIDEPDDVVFRLVGSGRGEMELIVDGRCHTAPPWPLLSAADGRIALVDPQNR